MSWRAGAPKPTGKFDKIPVSAVTRRNINPLDPSNWLSIDDAIDACNCGKSDGIGIVLSDEHPINLDGVDFYLTAVDLDDCSDRTAECQALWRQLGRPYLEVSPSGKGLRMLGLSRTAVRGGNAGGGRELYATKRFVTITGWDARGTLADFTNEIVAVDERWFGTRGARNSVKTIAVQTSHPEAEPFVRPVLAMLDTVSSDTEYETWRDIIWSVASTGWNSARHIAHVWSRKAQHRYDAAALDRLFDDFDPGRGITLGTLIYHGRKNGWSGEWPPTTQQIDQPMLMTADQLRQIPVPPYVVRGVLPAKGLAAIYGDPGSGKSFLALHLAHAVATGAHNWFGFRIRQAPVVYVALEGQGGMGRRITALERHSKQLCPDAFRICCRDIHLLTGEGIDDLASNIVATVGRGAVIIIDTLNQASPGAEENTSQDMGQIIASAKRLASEVNGLVIFVHHSGKERSRGPRGHSSLLGAMDAVIEVVKEASGRSWSIRKAKDDSGDEARDFDLIPYEVGHDSEGAIMSCAVQQALHVKAPKRRQLTGKHQKAAVAELRRCLTLPGQSLDYKQAISCVAAILTTAKPHERAKEAVDALIRADHLLMNEGVVSLT
ncbi:AAA family ATPase [Sphingobium mellinum]|uniref:AAA family ATPase n=1 Tax=Sphingobium mellinum TaxID=1387166 RepID=UPI0030EDFFFF